MAVLEQQISADVGGLARSGATVRASNFNSKIVTVFDDERGTLNFPATSVQLFDDYLGAALAATWVVNHGTDTLALDAAINAQVGGVVRLTSGDSAVVAESLSSLSHGLNWKANQGGLYLEARIKAASLENVCINVGFSDALSTTSLEEPITLSGTTLTTAATDAVVFVFDTAATNDTIHIQGVKNNTDTVLNNTGQTFSADVYTKLGVAIDSSGNAEFFINDQSYGVVANAVTATVALTPIFTVMARSTAVKTLDVDYTLVAAARA